MRRRSPAAGGARQGDRGAGRRPRGEVTVPALRQLVEGQDDSLLTAVGGFDGKVCKKLAFRLLTLWLNGKALLGGGELLDVDGLLGTGPHARPERVQLAVISTRFLSGDPARVHFQADAA